MSPIKVNSRNGGFRRYMEDWEDCKRCRLSDIREKIVHGRGKLPAQLFFLGEAPGPAEDVLGEPFVGPAGRILDALIAEVGEECLNDPQCPFIFPTYFITNTVGCFPADFKGHKFRKPAEQEKTSCCFRWSHLLDVAKPKLLITLGKVAEEFVEAHYRSLCPKVPRFALQHPSFILRQGGASSQAFSTFVVKLRDVLRTMRRAGVI